MNSNVFHHSVPEWLSMGMKYRAYVKDGRVCKQKNLKNDLKSFMTTLPYF